MIYINLKGNLESIKDSVLNEIEALYDIEEDKGDFIPKQLVLQLAYFTEKINREIAVYLNRRGNVTDISIGDSSTVKLPEVDGRRGAARLSGIRCIHTHPGGDGMLSSVDISTLKTLRLDSMIAVGVKDGEVKELYAGFVNEEEKVELYGPFDIHFAKFNYFFDRIQDIEKNSKQTGQQVEDTEERAILVGIDTDSGNKHRPGAFDSERSLDELEELAKTAGAITVHKILQKKQTKDPAYFIGRGKIDELNLMRQSLNANLIIFDDELSGAQVRNIEEAVGVKVIDRTTLILDIFAQRARSKEGKLQVELAQLKYMMPRLMGLGNVLSRLGGGIGTRGPGEKKLEVDRRHLRRRISFLESELEQVEKRREFLRGGRKKNNVPSIAIVGYTNAGKSTLMNTLCNSDIFAEDKLFATLDPTTRQLMLSDGREALITDTVGFIRKLPHELVEAFKSTLEEALYADILLHVVDVSNDDAEVEAQIQTVEKILEELGASGKPVVLALNKIDAVTRSERVNLAYSKENIFEVSAIAKTGLEELVKGLTKLLEPDFKEVELMIPYDKMGTVSFLHDQCKVLDEQYLEHGISIKAQVGTRELGKVKDFIRA